MLNPPTTLLPPGMKVSNDKRPVFRLFECIAWLEISIQSLDKVGIFWDNDETGLGRRKTEVKAELESILKEYKQRWHEMQGAK